MNTIKNSGSADLTKALHFALLTLARREDELAVAEASLVRYWEPSPTSVQGHRAAAVALRIEAANLALTA